MVGNISCSMAAVRSDGIQTAENRQLADMGCNKRRVRTMLRRTFCSALYFHIPNICT